MQNNILNLDCSNLASLCYFWNGYCMESFRIFYWDKTSALSHWYFGWPWVSHFSLSVLPSLWLHLFISLALSFIMCTHLQILIWLFWCYIHTNYNNNDNINGPVMSFWVYRKKSNISIVVSLPERNQLEVNCLLSPLNIYIIFKIEQGQGDLMCIKLN